MPLELNIGYPQAPAVQSGPPGFSDDSQGNEATILQQVSKAKHKAEATAILAALNSTRWNRKQAAALLKIDYKALLYKMKKLSIEDKVLSFDVQAASAADGGKENGWIGCAGAN